VILSIESLAAGSDAVARDQGKVVFVAGGAPGDRVEAEIVESHAGWSRARVLRVIDAGPARVVARCPYARAGTCGGSPWQHVAREAQLAAKHAIVANALRKLDGVRIDPIVAAAPDVGWRRRARLHWIHAGSADAVIGFYAPRSHRITDIEACPQLEPRLERALSEIRTKLAPALRARGEIHLAAGSGDAIHVVIDGPCDPGAAAALVGSAGIAGVRVGDRAFGASAIEIDDGVAAAADDFAQASEAGNRALGQIVSEMLGAPRDDGRALLELYAGAGNLTRHARALGWRVTATDVVAPARPLDEVETITAPIDRVFEQLRDRAFDAVLLDPPRAGAKEAMPHLRAPHIIYVSCDPATLARDAQVLAGAGYAATRAVPIDLMPDTAHVEVVVRFERS